MAARPAKVIILIVDREKMLIDLLIREISSDNLTAVGAASVDEAVRQIAAHSPALVVVDSELPDAALLFKSIQSDPVKRKIIALAGSENAREVVSAMGIESIVGRDRGLAELVIAIRNSLGPNVNVMGGDETVHILVADDSDELREMMSEFLIRNGYTVAVAVNGREAIEVVKKDPKVQIVLLDLSMPEMGGLEALKEIMVIKPDLGVIVMTAVNDSEVARIAVKAGASDYILKPFRLDQVQASINACLHHAEYKKQKKWWRW
jgi:DNA-binding NtrC family response regulator